MIYYLQSQTDFTVEFSNSKLYKLKSSIENTNTE